MRVLGELNGFGRLWRWRVVGRTAGVEVEASGVGCRKGGGEVEGR